MDSTVLCDYRLIPCLCLQECPLTRICSSGRLIFNLTCVHRRSRSVTPPPASLTPRHPHDPEPQRHLGGLEPFQLLAGAGTPPDPPQRHLRGFLPPRARGGCGLHRLLPAHLPGVHGGQRRGVFHRAAQQEHAHRHQPVHPQPGHQRPAGRHLLHAHHSGGQHHHRSGLVLDLEVFLVEKSFIHSCL